ncbi:MAG: 50S ribosomal protein L21 [Gammaproteobacteria bacterium]|jgi:large subunit ribosomal protein L21
MYAVILAGSKQCKVAVGDTIEIEKLAQEPNDKIEFDQVLLVAKDGDIKIGTPYLEGAKVLGEVVKQSRAEKIEVIKFRRRKHSMKKMGHRQYITSVKITDIKED